MEHSSEVAQLGFKRRMCDSKTHSCKHSTFLKLGAALVFSMNALNSVGSRYV